MPLVAGLDGAWILTPRLAEIVAPLLRREVDEARRCGNPVDPTILSELEAGEQAAQISRERRGVVTDVVGRNAQTLSPPKMVDVGRASEVSVTDAAEILGVRRQAVDARCRRGTLPHRTDEHGHRWIRRDALRAKSTIRTERNAT